MQDTYKEQLSSLLDHELELSEAQELVKVLKQDDELNKQLDRFALIRDAFIEDVVVRHDSFLSGVQRALAEEPGALSGRRWSQVIKPYIAIALAASMAFFTLVLFDIDMIGNRSEALLPTASVDIEKDEVLAYEELVFEELEEQAGAFQETNPNRAQLVTFEK
tara:strand:- start:110 stop:598 length:489 start_codon:yes stop_codon:yes gene_type:complete